MTLTHSSRIPHKPDPHAGSRSGVTPAARPPQAFPHARISEQPRRGRVSSDGPPGPQDRRLHRAPPPHYQLLPHTNPLPAVPHTNPLFNRNALHRCHTHTLPLPSVQRAAEHAARHISRSVSQRCLQQTSIFRRPKRLPGAIASHTAPPTNPSDRPRAANEPQTRKFGSQIDPCFQ